MVLLAAGVGGSRVAAQTSAPPTLRQQVEQRFDVLTVQDGLVLRPKSPVRDVRWVEVTGGTITVNGAPVSGAELRDKLGDDAGVVMQLSYLDPAARDGDVSRRRQRAEPSSRSTPAQTDGEARIASLMAGSSRWAGASRCRRVKSSRVTWSTSAAPSTCLARSAATSWPLAAR